VRRRAIRTAMIVAMGFLLVPTLVAAAPGQRWGGGGSGGRGNHGWGGPRWHNWSGHGRGHWHGSGWCCGGFAIGVGVGTLLTAPFWAYPRVYAAPAYPVYAPPAYPVYAPYPAYPVYPGYPGYPAAYPAYEPGAVNPAPPPPSPPGGFDPASPGPPASDAPGSLVPTPQPMSSGPGAPPESFTGVVPSGSGVTSAAPPPPAGCETVTVAGHWEMRVYPDGQRLTVWVPTSTRSVCR
jgi:hypothetical protein